MNTTAVSEIKACNGVYRAADVARAYDVHRSTVKRIWEGQLHSDIRPAPDFPDIEARPRPEDRKEDIALLLERGLSVAAIAATLDMSERSVYLYKGLLGGFFQ